MTTDPDDGMTMASAVAIQGDGRIVVAGHATRRRGSFGVVRLDPDGSPDTSFGRGGMVRTSFTPRSDAAHDIAVQPNGRILVAGRASALRSRFALARYLPDGTLDASFGRRGKVVTNFTRGRDIAFGIALQADRRIVAAGHAGGTADSPADHRFAFARYRRDGSLDPAFGGNGKRMVNFTPGDDWANDVAIQPDGRIVAAGRAEAGGGSVAVTRLLAS